MKRVIVYGLLTLILGTVLAVWAAGTWLLESPDGIRWLLREVSRRTTVKIDARYVTGGIGKTLRMEGVTVRWPHGEAAVQELRLRCRPLWLPFGKLAVQELSLRGVSIQDNEPDSGKPPDLTWPQLTGTPDWLDAWIDRLQVDGLSYRRLETPPVTVTGISAALTWRHAVLTATNLDVTTPGGPRHGGGYGRIRPPRAHRGPVGHPGQTRLRLFPLRSPGQAAPRHRPRAACRHGLPHCTDRPPKVPGTGRQRRNDPERHQSERARGHPTGTAGHRPGGRDRPPYRLRAPDPPGPPGGRPRPLAGNRHDHRPHGGPLRGGDRNPLRRTVRPEQHGECVADGPPHRLLLG